MSDLELERAAAAWRSSGSAADFVAAAERLAIGTDGTRVRELLGAPKLVSSLANGGESWLYLSSDASRRQLESLFVRLDAAGKFLQLDRKPID